MTIKFIICGEVEEVKDWKGPEPQIGDKIFLDNDEYYDMYEVIRRSINITKPEFLTCYLDMIK